MPSINDKLTEKQELFSLAMFTIGSLSFGNGRESARTAQYKGNNNTLDQIAHKLVSNGKVKNRKEQIQAIIMEKIEHNRDISLNNLTKAFDLAVAQGNPAAMIAAEREKNSISWLHGQTVRNEDTDAQELSERQKVEAKRLAGIRLVQDIA